MEIDRRVREDYENLLDSNPLKKLPFQWQKTIWCLLAVAFNPGDRKTEIENEVTDTLKVLHKAASSCEELCRLMRILRNQNFGLYLPKQKFLEVLLLEYSKKLKFFSIAMPEAGQYDRHLSTSLMVKASCMVRVSTRKYNDAHLSALAQLIVQTDEYRDLDAEAIRKRRDRFRKEYLGEYANLEIEARLLHSKNFKPNQTAVAPNAGEKPRRQGRQAT